MKAFTHIKLTGHKGLKEGSLVGLGKINVVCGPNNSGKTTVLESIADANSRIVGKVIDLEIAKQIEQKYMAGRTFNERRCEIEFPKVIAETGASKPAWFRDESGEFQREVVARWKARFPNFGLSDPMRLENLFLDQYASPPKVVLVPAKRGLHTQIQVSSSETVQPHGTGILNRLFVAKNQDEFSELRLCYEKICVAFRDITTGYEFDVFLQPSEVNGVSPSQTKIELKFRASGQKWIQAKDCGLGLCELLIMLYFALASDFDVVLVEEPETHLHPEIQRRLIAFLKHKSDKQFFLSTHSSVFLNTRFADRVFMCRMTDAVTVTNATNRAAALSEMGYSIADNLLSDLVVLCEGPKDKLVLEEFFLKMGMSEFGNIKVWPLGGDIMDQLDLTVFQEAHRLIALIDGDPGSSIVRKRFMKRCEELSIPVTRLNRYAMENYFTLEAIGKVMKGQMPPNITLLDPSRPVGEQLGFEVKNNGGRIANEMTLEDIRGTDLEDFLNLAAAIVRGKSD